MSPLTPQARKTSVVGNATSPTQNRSEMVHAYIGLQQKLRDAEEGLLSLNNRSDATKADRTSYLMMMTDNVNTVLQGRHIAENMSLADKQKFERQELKKKHGLEERALLEKQKREADSANQKYAAKKAEYIRAERVLEDEKTVKMQARNNIKADIERTQKSLAAGGVCGLSLMRWPRSR